MDLMIGAQVTCQGVPVGTLQRLIVDRTVLDLREIVVARSGLLTNREIIVPVERIYQANEKVVTLEMSLEDFENLPDFKETLYTRVDPGSEGRMPSSAAPILGWPYYIPQARGSDLMPTVEKQTIKHVESDAREVTAGMAVYAGGDKVGEVKEVIVDSSDKRATSIVIARGWLLKHDIQIPADWVSTIENDRVLLNRSKDQIEEFDRGTTRPAGPDSELPL